MPSNSVPSDAADTGTAPVAAHPSDSSVATAPSGRADDARFRRPVPPPPAEAAADEAGTTADASAVDDAEADTSEADTSEAETSGADHSTVDDAEVDQSGADDAEVDQSGANRAEADTPKVDDAEGPAADVERAEASEPATDGSGDGSGAPPATRWADIGRVLAGRSDPPAAERRAEDGADADAAQDATPATPDSDEPAGESDESAVDTTAEIAPGASESDDRVNLVEKPSPRPPSPRDGDEDLPVDGARVTSGAGNAASPDQGTLAESNGDQTTWGLATLFRPDTRQDTRPDTRPDTAREGTSGTAGTRPADAWSYGPDGRHAPDSQAAFDGSSPARQAALRRFDPSQLYDPREAPPARRHPGRRRAAIAAGGVLGVLALLWLVGWLVAGAGVAPGTSVLGVDIGGMSRDAAADKLRSSLAERASAGMEIAIAGRSASLSPAEAGLGFDPEATVNAAGGRDWRPRRLITAVFGDKRVEPVVTLDAGRLDAALGRVARGVERPAREGGIRFERAEPVAVAPVPGTRVDRAAAAQVLKDSYLRSSGPITLSMAAVAPRVDRAEVERAMSEFAQPAVSAPITIAAGGKSVEVPPQAFAPALSVRPDAEGRLQPVLNGAVLSAAIDKIDPSFQQPPKDAELKVVGGRPTVVPAEDGRTVQSAALATAVIPVLTVVDDERRAEVELALTKPKVSTAAIEALGVKEKLASFTQPFPYAPYRVTNIGRAGRYVDGTILKPGEIFSMNGTIKERTEANGYTIGTIIDQGRFRRELGGGVSTITTAMWTAAFYAGLERVEQRAHSLWISRYKPGLEATVAYGSLDLKFRNNTPHAVLITAKTGRDYVTVTMWGTKVYDRIEAVSGPRRNIVPFKRVYDEKPDCTPQDGSNGFDITVTRVFYRGGAEVKRENFTTHYDKTDDVTCGPAPKADPPPVDPPPPPPGTP